MPVDDAAELGGLPPQVVQRAAAEASQRGRDGWLLTLDFPTYHAVMTQAENRGLRETFYHGWVTRASDQGVNDEWDNSSNIEKILALRHEAAKLVGFDSYADYSLATKMAETSGQVIGFLRDLAAHSRPAAEAELAELRGLAGMTVEPWDLREDLARPVVQRRLLIGRFVSEYVIRWLLITNNFAWIVFSGCWRIVGHGAENEEAFVPVRSEG